MQVNLIHKHAFNENHKSALLDHAVKANIFFKINWVSHRTAPVNLLVNFDIVHALLTRVKRHPVKWASFNQTR